MSKNITLENLTAFKGYADKVYSTKAELANAGSDVDKAYVDSKVSSLNGDIANRLPKNLGATENGKYLKVDTDGAIATTELPKATTSNLGVVKVNSSFGILTNAGGDLYINKASNNIISDRSNNWLPIVTTNYDYAVKCALTDGKGAAYTEDEKASARARLGAESSDWELVADCTLTEDTADNSWLTIALSKECKEIFVIYDESGISGTTYSSLRIGATSNVNFNNAYGFVANTANNSAWGGNRKWKTCGIKRINNNLYHYFCTSELQLNGYYTSPVFGQTIINQNEERYNLIDAIRGFLAYGKTFAGTKVTIYGR